MGALAARAFYGAAGSFFLFAWLVPAGILFLAYLIYIAVMVIRELRK